MPFKMIFQFLIDSSSFRGKEPTNLTISRYAEKYSKSVAYKVDLSKKRHSEVLRRGTKEMTLATEAIAVYNRQQEATFSS